MQWIDDLLRQANAAAAARPELIACVELLQNVTPYVHPAAEPVVRVWMSEMREAAYDGDATTVASVARLLRARIEQEQLWHAESLCADPATNPPMVDAAFARIEDMARKMRMD
jgi:hypothetical protein